MEYSECGSPAGHRLLFCSVPAALDTGLCGGTIVFHRRCSFLFCGAVSAVAPGLVRECRLSPFIYTMYIFLPFSDIVDNFFACIPFLFVIHHLNHSRLSVYYDKSGAGNGKSLSPPLAFQSFFTALSKCKFIPRSKETYHESTCISSSLTPGLPVPRHGTIVFVSDSSEYKCIRWPNA